VATLEERGLIEDCGRSQFGAILYRTSSLFQRLFGLASMDALPDPTAFDPSPEEEGELRDRLLRAGEMRAGGPQAAQGQPQLPVPEIAIQEGDEAASEAADPVPLGAAVQEAEAAEEPDAPEDPTA
jgi:segregation and condensation protein B